MHRVVVVAYPGVVLFDLATPYEGFRGVRLPDGSAAYDVLVCGVTREVDAGGLRLQLRYGLEALRRADTVILPGVTDIDRPLSKVLLRAVRRAAARGSRIASICSGAFVLAASGLLDGKRATTHWLAAAELTRRFPNIEVDPNVLFVDEGQVLSSAGAAAGIDLCLHMIRRDHGAAAAASAARMAVVPLERQGGQAQFIEHRRPLVQATLGPILDWMEANLEGELTLPDIARRAGMSVRSLNRHFREETGSTPLQWLLRARVRRAQVLLETTRHPIERVASHAGFGSPAAFRVHFYRAVATSPQAYRRAFQESA